MARVLADPIVRVRVDGSVAPEDHNPDLALKDDEVAVRRGDVVVPEEGRRLFEAFDAKGGVIVAGTPVVMDYNAGSLNPKAGVFEYSLGVVTILQKGTIRVTAPVTIGTLGTGDFEAVAKIQLDTGSGFVDVPGTERYGGKAT